MSCYVFFYLPEPALLSPRFPDLEQHQQQYEDEAPNAKSRTPCTEPYSKPKQNIEHSVINTATEEHDDIGPADSGSGDHAQQRRAPRPISERTKSTLHDVRSPEGSQGFFGLLRICNKKSDSEVLVVTYKEMEPGGLTDVLEFGLCWRQCEPHVEKPSEKPQFCPDSLGSPNQLWGTPKAPDVPLCDLCNPDRAQLSSGCRVHDVPPCFRIFFVAVHCC